MSQRTTILLVEDNPDDEAFILDALNSRGVAQHVNVVHDGVEALDYLFCNGAYANRSPESAPTLVLMDIHMPRMSGLAVLERIRSDCRTARLPVVMLTSSSADGDVFASYRLGANSYVRKHVDLADFAAELGRLWLLLTALERTPQE